jgi:hypothetical protein
VAAGDDEEDRDKANPGSLDQLNGAAPTPAKRSPAKSCPLEKGTFKDSVVLVCENSAVEKPVSTVNELVPSETRSVAAPEVPEDESASRVAKARERYMEGNLGIVGVIG